MIKPSFFFRRGALDHIMRSRLLRTDQQLAKAIGVRDEDIPALRAGAPVTARVALHVSALQGDENYLDGLFVRLDERDVA